MPRLELRGEWEGYKLKWGGVEIFINRDEWDHLVAQAMDLDARRKIQ